MLAIIAALAFTPFIRSVSAGPFAPSDQQDREELRETAVREPAPTRSWFKRRFVKPDLEQVLEECKTPQDICNMVRRHIVYKEEGRDRWWSARDTWERGKGDCEDFAVCIQMLCKEQGFDATVELFYPAKIGAQGHALVIGEWDGQLWMSSNGSFEKIQSRDEAKACVARILWCDKKKIWSRTLEDKDIEKLINKSASPGVASRTR